MESLEETMNALRLRVKAILKAKRWTQKRLAKETGFSEPNLSRMLNGPNIELGSIKTLENALGEPIFEVSGAPIATEPEKGRKS